MCKNSNKARMGDFRASVAFNDCITRDIFRMGLLFTGEAADLYAELVPGQFAEMDLSRTRIPPQDKIPPHLVDKLQRQIILRRPFSFSDAYRTDDGTIAELIYAALGPASLRMSTVQVGDSMDVIGPLGRGFKLSKSTTTALLVGGGLGTPPIIHLARVLRKKHPAIQVAAIVGARDYKALPFDLQCTDQGILLPPFEDCHIPYLIATDDGSAGHQGLVTDCLNQWFEKNPSVDPQTLEIFTCGPEPMLAAVAALAQTRGLACQVSLERRMACGFNLCQGCAVECRLPKSDDTVYKMCCQEGPVFDAEEVVFEA